MTKHFPYIYQATVCWYEDGEAKHYRVAGLGFCEDFTDAMHQIEAREGDNLESIEHLELIGERDETIIEIPVKAVKDILEHDPAINIEKYTKEHTYYGKF